MEAFDKYLSGQMSDEERRSFEKKLAEEPAWQAELLVREGLQQLRIREATAAATQLRKRYERRARLQRIAWAGITAVLVLGALVWRYFPKSTGSAPAPRPSIESPADSVSTQPPGPAPSPGPVIAEKQQDASAADPFLPTPDVRGSNADTGDWPARINELWHTVYPPANGQLSETFAAADTLLRQSNFALAYVRLQRLEMRLPANDTLRLMKGYCLLEMREGAEALQYLENLETRQPEWKTYLEWHRGLALLLAGDRTAATQEFRAIAAQADHPFATQARKALDVLGSKSMF